MIIIHAIFQVDPAKQQSFLEEIHPLIHSSREESGNVSYDLYKDTEKENVYTMDDFSVLLGSSFLYKWNLFST